MLYAYNLEFLHYDWSTYGEFDRANEHAEGIENEQGYDNDKEEFIHQTEEMQKLEKQLAGMGYHFSVISNEETLYSNMTSVDLEAVRDLYPTNDENLKFCVISDHSHSFIKNIMENGEKTIEIQAISFPNGNITPNDTYIQKYIYTSMLAFFLFILLAVALTSFLFSRFIYKTIANPMKELQDGAREIRNGNLDYRIQYDKKDEFGEVCSDFNEMREYLKTSNEEKMQVEQHKKNLIAEISHDLRTPLTSIKGYVEGLKDNIAKDDEKKQQYYNAIHTRSLDMEKLLNQLLVLSKLENQEFTYHLTVCHFSRYINDWIKKNLDEFHENDITINFEDSSTNDTVNIDTNEMDRVFSNLLDNAKKYCTEKPIEILLSLKNVKNQVEIMFSDNGNGIQDQNVQNIFQRFYREDVSGTKSNESIGLGLTIVKEIVDGHAGLVFAKSIYKNGNIHSGLGIVIRIPVYLEKL